MSRTEKAEKVDQNLDVKKGRRQTACTQLEDKIQLTEKYSEWNSPFLNIMDTFATM